LYENKVEKIGRKFHEDIDNGLAEWSIVSTKIVKGRSIEEVSNDYSVEEKGAVEPFLDVVPKSNMKLTGQGGIENDKDRLEMPYGFEEYGNVFMKIEPLIVSRGHYENIQRSFFQKLLSRDFSQHKEWVTDSQQPATSGDFGDAENAEPLFLVSINYYLDTSQYKDKRPNSCKLKIKMRASLVGEFLKEVEGSSRKFWEILRTFIPELLPACPPAMYGKGKKALGILRDEDPLKNRRSYFRMEDPQAKKIKFLPLS
jgi:hypothetical protein